MPRFATDSKPISAPHPITEFYRQEFIKHQRCLQQQRPYYSESAITDVETALTDIMELRQIDLGLAEILERVREGSRGPRTGRARPARESGKRKQRPGKRERKERQRSKRRR